MSFVWSANDLGRTRLCAAQNCPNDADVGHAICTHCRARQHAGHPITLHETPALQEELLNCSTCHKWLPEDLFKMYSGRAPVGRRRGRKGQCKPCDAARKRVERLHLTEQQRQQDRDRRAAKRAAKRAV